jgi:3-phosphoshikimate 1-carboxyvinyltransferase
MIDYTLPLDQLPDPLPIEPLTKPFDVTITPPGSKSITCRAYVLAALAEGESKIIRPLRADDTDHLLNALCTLGAQARWEKSSEHDAEDVYIKGVGGRFPRGGSLYMGEGGTPTRFMIACACLAKEPVVIDASQRMRERPIAEGVDMLRQLGAKIEYVEEEGRLPVRVVPSDLAGGAMQIGITETSQFISAMLLIGWSLRRGVHLKLKGDLTSESYVGLTVGLLRIWGVESAWNKFSDGESTIDIEPQNLFAYDFVIESDASGATYLATAAALAPASSKITLRGLFEWSAQADAMYVQHVLPEIGALVCFDKDGTHVMPRPGVSADRVLQMFWMPDAALTVAAAASFLQGQTKITGLRTLRVKETDRIAALANELRKVGCVVETGEDWISITPPDTSGTPARRFGSQAGQTVSGTPGSDNRVTSPIIIETYNDHRMAMAFAVLGLNPPNGIPLAIRNPRCVAKSYPTFWKDFAKLYQ